MELFVATPSVFRFLFESAWRLVALALGAAVFLTVAYFLSRLISDPKQGPEATFYQLAQKALVLILVFLGGYCVWRLQHPGTVKWINFAVLGAWVLLFATLLMAWARSAFPIGGQEIPILAKLGALCLLCAITVLLLVKGWSFFGGKILPHALGIAPPGGKVFLYDFKVMLPGAIWAGCILFLAFLAGVILVSLYDANWASAPSKWLFPSPAAFLSAFLFLLIAGSGFTYYEVAANRNRSRQELLDMQAARRKEGIKDALSGDPASRTRYVRLSEWFLATREWNLQTFHRVADDPHSLGYSFPGFMIGLEKAGRNIIGVPMDEEKLGDPAKEDEARRHGSRKLLADRKRIFVSHIAEFNPAGGEDRAECCRKHAGIGPRFHFNLYGSPGDNLACERAGKAAWESPQESYAAGFDALDHLGEVLKVRLEQAPKPFTHVMVMCMGWNTDQQEAIRNYNSLRGYLEEAALRADPSVPFRPLVIGLSWPSQWAGFLPASYPTKADDADETGLVWGSYLLKKVLAPIKREYAEGGKPFRLVLVGHSFGTRVLTRAMASDPGWVKRGAKGAPVAAPLTAPDVDLFVGLQGAFSIDRFVDRGPLTGGGQELAPYKELPASRTRFVFTWSKEDKANPVAAYVTAANHIGGSFGADLAADHPEIFASVAYEGPADSADVKAMPRDTSAPTGRAVTKATGTFGPEGWDPAFWQGSRGRVLMVNLSEVVKHTPYGKGGKAHSDIYKYPIGHFLWKTLRALETPPGANAAAAGPESPEESAAMAVR